LSAGESIRRGKFGVQVKSGILAVISLLLVAMALAAGGCKDSASGANPPPVLGCATGKEAECDSLDERCFQGQCSPEESAGAALVFRNACESGVARSCTSLGALYAGGISLPEDDERASRLFDQACNGGDAEGCNDLGTWFTSSSVIVESVGTAKGLISRLSNKYRSDGSWKDDRKALELFEKACDAGSSMGCMNAGHMYEVGVGTHRDAAKARLFYKKSAGG
jgi:hypothetical protein